MSNELYRIKPLVWKKNQNGEWEANATHGWYCVKDDSKAKDAKAGAEQDHKEYVLKFLEPANARP